MNQRSISLLQAKATRCWKPYGFVFGLILNISLLANVSFSQQIIFAGYNADDVDGIAFLCITDIPANTTIYFSDNEYNSGAFNTGESFFQWSHNQVVAQGTVVVISDLNQGTLNAGAPNPSASIGTAIWSVRASPNNNSGLANSDEIVYAYLGTAYSNPTTFLTSIANDGFSNGGGSAQGYSVR